MKRFINKFQTLKGAKFISVNEYLAKTSGEIANHVINVNINVLNAKQNDFEKLQGCTDKVLKTLTKTNDISLETFQTALFEMLKSAEKNLSANKADRTNQSKAQTDSYVFLTPAIKLHKETMQVHIFGQSINKTVLKAGEYKSVNSSDKTIAKRMITKHLDLRAGKFRNFILGNVDTLKVSGETIRIVKA